MISHDMRLDHHPLSQVAQGLRVLQQISLLEKRSTAPPRVNTEGIGFFAASEFFFVLSWVYDRYIEHDRTSCGRMLSGELRLRNQLGATTLHERS